MKIRALPKNNKACHLGVKKGLKFMASNLCQNHKCDKTQSNSSHANSNNLE